ncbi:Indolepyruvate ferredoxin oxidoreductase, beta subunit (fragment) [Syntrophobacter sp. SbD2]
MVLLAALIRSGKIPVTSENIKGAIGTKVRQVFVEINLKAFDFGFTAAQTGRS